MIFSTSIKKCDAIGENAYVMKPLNFSDFLDAVKHIVVSRAILN